MNRTFRLIILGLIIIGFGLYAFNFGNALFWDDDDWIIDNPVVHSLSWENVQFLFSHDVLAGIGQSSNYYRPILSLSFALNWVTGGDSPFGYHLVSNALHIGSAILLFLLLAAFLKSRKIAVVAALFWLIHPLNTEAVAYISGRGDPLSVFLMLSALSAWLIGRGHWSDFRPSRTVLWQTGAIAAAVLAVLSRETAVLFPAYLMLFLMTFTYRERFWRALLRSLKEVWPFIGISVAYGVLRVTLLNFENTLNWHRVSNIYSESILIRTWTFFGALWEYFYLAFVPVGLHMERDVPVLTSPLVWPVPLVILLLVLLLWQTVRSWRRGNRIWFFGAAWFFVALAPASGVAVPINALIYEHWLYLPLIGLATVLAFYAVHLYEWAKQRGRTLGIFLLVLGVLYAGFLSFQAVRRNIIWGDTERFYLQILSYESENVRVLNNLANFYAGEEQPEKAEEYWLRAIEADPTQPAPYHNLANLARDRGRIEEAEELYLTAIEKQETFHYAYRNLSSIYLEQRRFQEALNLLLVLEELSPTDVAVHYAVAQLYFAAGRHDLSRQALDRGVPYLSELAAIQAYEELLQKLK